MKTLYWIDDTHDHQKLPNRAAKARLEKGLRVKLNVQPVKERDQFGKLLSALDCANTCGVLMDYQLTEVGDNGQMAYGNTWAAEIRAACPSVPVIGISHELEKSIPKLCLEGFLAFYPRDELMGLNPPLDDLVSLLSGYSKVVESDSSATGVERMTALIEPPEATADLIRASIPPPLRGAWDVETPHTASRWLWHDFQGLPGFLFDELGLATHLGLSRIGIRRIVKKFDLALYRGAFASRGRLRWWVGAIRGILETLIGRGVVGPISTAREELLKVIRVPSKDRAPLLSHPHGYRSSNKIPECVAYRDDQLEEHDRVQALLEDTYVDERDANPAFGFEARRIFAINSAK